MSEQRGQHHEGPDAEPHRPDLPRDPDPVEEAAEEGHVDGSNPAHVENPLDQPDAANEKYR
jgi:hypothetical protein